MNICRFCLTLTCTKGGRNNKLFLLARFQRRTSKSWLRFKIPLRLLCRMRPYQASECHIDGIMRSADKENSQFPQIKKNSKKAQIKKTVSSHPVMPTVYQGSLGRSGFSYTGACGKHLCDFFVPRCVFAFRFTIEILSDEEPIGLRAFNKCGTSVTQIMTACIPRSDRTKQRTAWSKPFFWRPTAFPLTANSSAAAELLDCN